MPRNAVIVGSGPNGLAAAIVLAQAGVPVELIEGHEQIGGGLRSASLTLPGFVHDVCASIHAMGAVSPIFRTLPLRTHGLEWILPLAPLYAAGVISPQSLVVVDGKSGVSGAGRHPKPETHFCEVNENLKAYGVLKHRHTPEMLAYLPGA